jgi:DNA replication licensing factor MCM4
MIRIAESLAKMRLANDVTQKDVEEAVRLIKTAMQQSATDPKTGQIDMDLLNTGVSASSATRMKEVKELIKALPVSTNFVTNFDLDFIPRQKNP